MCKATIANLVVAEDMSRCIRDRAMVEGSTRVSGSDFFGHRLAAKAQHAPQKDLGFTHHSVRTNDHCVFWARVFFFFNRWADPLGCFSIRLKNLLEPLPFDPKLPLSFLLGRPVGRLWALGRPAEMVRTGLGFCCKRDRALSPESRSRLPDIGVATVVDGSTFDFHSSHRSRTKPNVPWSSGHGRTEGRPRR
jgi:hypothetical protein